MSIKQQLAEALESLPESTNLEEAFDRLYAAFKLKMEKENRRASPSPPPGPRPIGLLRGQWQVADSFFDPLPPDVLAGFCGEP